MPSSSPRHSVNGQIPTLEKVQLKSPSSSPNSKTHKKRTTESTDEHKVVSDEDDKENMDVVSNNEEESDSEYSSSEDDDDLYEGITDPGAIKAMKDMMKSMSQGYQKTSDQLQKENVDLILNIIQFNLDITITADEAAFIHDFCKAQSVNLQERIETEGTIFLNSLREMYADKEDYDMNDHNNNNGFASGDDADDTYNSDDGDDGDWLAQTKKKKADRKQKRNKKNLSKNTNLDGSKRCGRVLLNDAMNDVTQQKLWSEARKKAWNTKNTKPNQYFYRFNAPGQKQKNGKWTKDEHKLFMQRVKQFGANGEWGVFSKRIPGRVGYQCSNYWRGLVKDKNVKDPNYIIDDNNKLHFKRNTKTFAISDDYRRFAFTVMKDISKVFSNCPEHHPKRPSNAYLKQVNDALENAVNDVKQKKRKRNTKNDKNANDDDYVEPKQKRRRRKKQKNDDDGDCAFSAHISGISVDVEDDNPMPDFIDLMTGATVSKPAISPYGHVLGYDTWTKILRTSKTKNLCPFTLQTMTRRSLIKLTKANYDEHKAQIVNLTKDQISMLAVINS